MFYTADPNGAKIPDSHVFAEEAEASDHEDLFDRDENIAGAYLKEVARIPLLTRKREVELGKRIQLGEQKISSLIRKCSDTLKKISRQGRELKGDWIEPEEATCSKEEIVREAVQNLEKLPQHPGSGENELRDLLAELRNTETDVKAAKAEMIQSNLRLVASIARIYVNRGLCFLDLIQEGNLGLMRAVTKYDYRKGFKFSTYASWWIRQAITRALVTKSKTVRIPVHLLERRRKVDKAIHQLIKELGRDPLPEEIAEKAGVSSKDVLKVKDLTQEPVSLETSVGEDGGKLEDLIQGEASVSFNDNLLENMELAEKTKDLLSFLKPREEQILRLRFGIGEPTSYTLQEIGKRLGISRERVRQIESKALMRLKTRPTDRAAIGVC